MIFFHFAKVSVFEQKVFENGHLLKLYQTQQIKKQHLTELAK